MDKEKTKQWKYAVENTKVRQFDLCYCCKNLGKNNQVDVVINIYEDKELKYDSSNLIGICESCSRLYGNRLSDEQKIYLKGLKNRFD